MVEGNAWPPYPTFVPWEISNAPTPIFSHTKCRKIKWEFVSFLPWDCLRPFDCFEPSSSVRLDELSLKIGELSKHCNSSDMFVFKRNYGKTGLTTGLSFSVKFISFIFTLPAFHLPSIHSDLGLNDLQCLVFCHPGSALNLEAGWLRRKDKRNKVRLSF